MKIQVGPVLRTFARAALVLSLTASAAHADDKAPAKEAPKEAPKAASKRIAVRSFAAKGVDSNVAATVETSFCSALANESLDVVCPDEIKALISVKQADLGLGNCDSDEECIKNIGKASDAGRVVTGEVSKLGESFIVSVAMIDSETGRVLSRASDKTPKVESLLDKLEGLAKKLAAAK